MTKAKTSKIKALKPNIPAFNSVQEQAEFWDTHDAADYLHELKPVSVTFAPELSDGITVRFDSATLAKIRSTAKDKGLGATTLIRMWVMERLSNGANSNP